MRMRASLFIGSAIVMLALMFVGCTPKPEDDVLAQYTRSEDAIATRNMAAYRDTLSTASIEHIQETISLACRATAEETKKLPCGRMETVLALRNRVPAEKLKKMEVVDYLEWQLKEEMMFVDADVGLEPYKVTISGDRARMQYGMRVEKGSSSGRFGRRGLGGLVSAASGRTRTKLEPIPDFFIHFERINGFWYHDLTIIDESYDEYCADEARQAGLKLHDYMAQEEKTAEGKLIKNIWEPVIKPPTKNEDR
jgi:hypothetical protein